MLELRREVCLVPQLPALLEGTVADNILYGARLAGTTPTSAAMLELVGLERRSPPATPRGSRSASSSA